MTLDEETARATEMLRGKMVKRVVRHREGEVLIEFEDGARFFADSNTSCRMTIGKSQAVGKSGK
ncbi:hypothetical protein [Sphingomonas sp. R1]|uniref:hypothetical protein n=1 Tax=Sphingomonas sp. R1 TaxID=399176 RepID=UPI002224A788|nr:hypothetical protein [Sphingomonas sp. R1]UYY76917.1 hypothetical protein OIM94_15650 [Sphingomonas sp. R1]